MGRGDMSTAKWMVFGLVDLAHSEKPYSSLEALEENKLLVT
jgi:hypothetical protein